MIVDYDGRILAQADPGPHEKIVVGPIDVAALRAERERRRGHDLLSHMRTELYRGYDQRIYPGGRGVEEPPSIERNEITMRDARSQRSDRG